jgi:hypothetical protein
MTRRDWAQLSLQVLGIYAVLCAIGPLEAIWPFLWPLIANLRVDLGWFVGVTAMLLLAGMYLTVGFFLFFRHAKLVQHMAPIEAATTRNAPTAREVQTIAFSVVGLWVALGAVPEVFHCASLVFRLVQDSGKDGTPYDLLLPSFRVVFRLGLAALLFLRADVLSEWWQRHQRKPATSP